MQDPDEAIIVRRLRRALIHMATVGDIGGDDAIPDWYPLLRAARDANMPPWELLDQLWWRDHDLLAAARYLNVPAPDLAAQPTWWRNIARIAERAEREATEAIQEHANQQQRQPHQP